MMLAKLFRYSVVGVLELLNISLTVLEHYLPGITVIKR
jgi:hypothetical protein